MEILIAIICGIFGIALLGLILLAPLKFIYWKELRQKKKDDLEKEVFDFADDYFSYIGYEHAEVQEFRDMIRERDLARIKANWKRLSKSFSSLERKVGHRGRPLIMDYYNWYEMAVNELHRRNR